MKIIAKKPISFGGRQFFINDEIPEELVVDPKKHEQLGTIAIVASEDGVSGVTTPGASSFTQEQVDEMVAKAVEEAVAESEQKIVELQEAAAELQETELGAYEGEITISLKGETEGQFTALPVKPEEVQQVFSIMQLNADEGAKAIVDVTSENVLILLHASDSRSTIKNAAKKQADNLFSANADSNEATNGNETTGTKTEGADT